MEPIGAAQLGECGGDCSSHRTSHRSCIVSVGQQRQQWQQRAEDRGTDTGAQGGRDVAEEEAMEGEREREGAERKGGGNTLLLNDFRRAEAHVYHIRHQSRDKNSIVDESDSKFTCGFSLVDRVTRYIYTYIYIEINVL